MPSAKLLLKVPLLREGFRILAPPLCCSDLITQTGDLLSRLLPVQHALSR